MKRIFRHLLRMFFVWLGVVLVYIIFNKINSFSSIVDAFRERQIRQMILPVILSYWMLHQNCTKRGHVLLSLFIAGFWGILLPFAKNLVKYHFLYFKSIGYEGSGTDIILSCWIFLFMVTMPALISLCRGIIFRKSLYLMISIITMLILFYPMVEIIHIIMYGFPIEENTIRAIQQTGLQESLEYIKSFIGYTNFVLLNLVIFTITGGFFYQLCKSDTFSHKKVIDKFAGKYKLLVLFLVAVVSIYIPLRHVVPRLYIVEDWKIIQDYIQMEKNYLNKSSERLDSIQLHGNPIVQKLPGTVIVVIGESASREYMKYYNPKIKYDNTPWLSSLKRNKDFIIFDNMYSAFNQTNISLERAITEMSQYNDKTLNESASIVEIARKSGYKTYWFSAQNGTAVYSNTADMIGTLSDRSESIREGKGENGKVIDEQLLPLLKSVDRSQNNFIVIHLKGSHNDYRDRYPKEYKKWDESNNLGSYSNSILYTDQLLKEIFEYARSNLDLQVMVYFSDHGEDIKKGHHPGIRKFNQVAIPFFVYLSPNYIKQYPSAYEALEYNKKAFSSNDMVYNIISGLLQAQSNRYDAGEDLSSKEYKFDETSVMTYLGTVHVNDSKALPKSVGDYEQ